MATLENLDDLASTVADTLGDIDHEAHTAWGELSITVGVEDIIPTLTRLRDSMPEDFRQPRKMEKPASPDDLKMISGVGPKLESVLNSLGIWTFAQIAEWTPEEVAWVDDYLQFKGRIERDDWIAQAAVLAKGGRDEYVKMFGKEPR